MAAHETKKQAPKSVTIGANAYPITDHSFDVVVVGAEVRAFAPTLGASQAGLRTANLTKVSRRVRIRLRRRGDRKLRSATWRR